jgi:hypothetical protein
MKNTIGAAILFLLLGCKTQGTIRVAQYASDTLMNESFDDASAVARSWTVDPQVIGGAKVQVEHHDGNSFISLMLPDNQESRELTLRRSVDLSAAAGHRVRLSARIQTSKLLGGSAHVRLSLVPPIGVQSYSDFVDSRSTSAESWTTVYVVVDVNPGSLRGVVAVTLSGTGHAWFDDIRITSLGPSPVAHGIRLSASLRERLATLTRALNLIRYFHPSDQSAKLDWDTFSVQAIESLLHTDNKLSIKEVLTQLFLRVAPTVRFVESTESISLKVPRDPGTTHLARWHHVGLGVSPKSSYVSFRDGIESEEKAYTLVYTDIRVPHLATCRTAEFRADIYSSTGQVWLLATLYQSGDRTSGFQQAVPAQEAAQVVVARGDVPVDVQQVRLNLYLAGRAAVELRKATWKCANGESVSIDAHAGWDHSRFRILYSKEITNCAATKCLSVRRIPPPTSIQFDRDVADIDIGSGCRILLPLVAWSDGKVTFPTPPTGELPPPLATIPDLPVRLAAVGTIWGTLRWFYPYFSDQHIDWEATLPRSIEEAAVAASSDELHLVLGRLVAALQDGHARVRHPTRSMLGMLPIALRKFGSRMVVVGGLPEYLTAIPVGSEIATLNGISIETAYRSSYSIISAATMQFREYLASLYLSVGAIGTFRHLGLRPPGQSLIDIVIPLVSREQFDREIRIHHPATGTQVTTSIFYVDAMKLDRTSLSPLIHTLRAARAVILDLRGYIKNEAFEFLAHFISSPIPSPLFRTPVVSVLSVKGYEDSDWILWPAEPRLTSRLIVLIDTRALSAAETLLQIIRDNHLGMFVGEPTAGTNGDVNNFTAPGGFEIRFTGVRASAPDGSTIQGNGILPDRVVHPTLEGIRLGRDEILEAAIAVAKQSGP